MTHRLPTRQYSLLAALRMLLVVVALLNFETAAAEHDHQGAGAEGLCAICVYGSSGGGALSTYPPHPPQLLPGAKPTVQAPPCAVLRARVTTAIRGPPPAG